MAERLKRENDIVTLKVALAPGDRVSCTLQWLDGGRLQARPLWEGPIAAFGIDCRQMSMAPRWDDVAYALPGDLRDALAHGLATLADLAPWREPALWVHLVKPYGALRFIPWERLLPEASALPLPVLMLPDFIFPPPRRSASGLDIALCASAPLHCEDHHVFDAMGMAIEAILSGLQAQAPRLHLFTDRDMADRLRGGPALPGNVRLHDPLQAAPFVVDDPASRLHDRAGSLRSPWLLWMREALRAYSVDVVHFVCHGHLSGQSGAMLFAQSPLARTDNYLAGPVGATELGSFMTQVGAWSTVFSPPRDNHAPAGLRALADEIAQTLPGPMLLHDGHHGTPDDLARGYRFVHADEAQSPPHAPSLYLYCQPYLLAEERGRQDLFEDGGSTRARIAHFARNPSQHASALRAAPMRTQTPMPTPTPAIAATERFAEKVQLQYQTLMRDDVVSHEVASRDMAASMDTVDLIRQAVNLIEQQRLATDIEARLDRIERGAPDRDDDGGAGEAMLPVIDMPPAVDRSREAAMKEVDAALAQLQAVQADAGPLAALPIQDGPAQQAPIHEASIEAASIQDTSIEPAAVADLEVRTLRIKDELLAQALRESSGDGLESGR